LRLGVESVTAAAGSGGFLIASDDFLRPAGLEIAGGDGDVAGEGGGRTSPNWQRWRWILRAM
jgi:hypothetical protein